MEQQEIQTLRALMEYEAARTAPPESFPDLPDIPAGRYTDPRFFELEQAEIFKKSWLFAAHLDEIPEPGCYMTWEQAGEPVVLVHTEAGEVKAFYNVCSHRGAPVVTEPKGKRLRLTCKYHGWSYSLDGDLKAIRDPEDFRDLDFSCRSLSGIRCETFGKFIFVNFDPDAISLLDWLGPIADEWREFQFDQCAKLSAGVDDIDLNLDDFVQRVNSDLIGKVVNIASRCAGFLRKKFDNRMSTECAEPELVQSFIDAGEHIASLYEAREFNRAMREIITLADRANQYIDEKKPWVMAKDETLADEVQDVCSVGVNLFRVLATYLKPVLPAMAEKSEAFLQYSLDWTALQAPLVDHELAPFQPLLQRVDAEVVTAMVEASKSST